MIPRGVIDIDLSTLLATAIRSFSLRSAANDDSERVERLWDSERSVVVSQSVRSGLDLVLSSFQWPAGSEILMTAATIHDMPRIVREHGLVPVPVDVDPESLSPDVTQLQSRITSRTKSILVAHLFGSRLDLSPIAQIARDRNLSLWEDVAQGFASDGFSGDSHADISFFSFGLIKAQTALGGAIMRIRDADLALQCRTVQSQWPDQPLGVFRKKICRAMMMRAVGNRGVFTALTSMAQFVGLDYDDWLSRCSRGFSPDRLFAQLRQQQCGVLVELLLRRLRTSDRRWLDQKLALAKSYCDLLPPDVLLGQTANYPSRWVLPIVSSDPVELVTQLRKRGFDATQRASHLRVVAAPVEHPGWTAGLTEDWVSRIVFLPLHPALRRKHIEAIAAIVCRLEMEKRVAYSGNPGEH